MYHVKLNLFACRLCVASTELRRAPSMNTRSTLFAVEELTTRQMCSFVMLTTVANSRQSKCTISQLNPPKNHPSSTKSCLLSKSFILSSSSHQRSAAVALQEVCFHFLFRQLSTCVREKLVRTTSCSAGFTGLTSGELHANHPIIRDLNKIAHDLLHLATITMNHSL
jgi:hypothetical protein